MKIANFDTNKEVFIIAEIGNNHEGNLDVAKKMIDAAATTGVQAVKFQTFITEYFVGKSNMRRYNQLKSYEFSFKQFEELYQHATNQGLIFLSTPFDLESAKFLNDLVPAFKIASSDNTFFPLIDYITTTQKPILVSSGLLDLAGVKQLQDTIYQKWEYHHQNVVKENLCLLHCVTSYPTKPKEANLVAIKAFKESLDCVVGYSDHVMGMDAVLTAIPLGARVIEKHFTLDKNYSDFRDHQLSADPTEMKMLVEKVKLVQEMLTGQTKNIQPSEVNIKPLVRRSIVAKRDLLEGHIVQWEDLAWTRPGGGMEPGKENLIVGKKLKQALKYGEKIALSMIVETIEA